MTDPRDEEPTRRDLDELDDLESATAEERAEAEALAHALEGAASETRAPPSDAASTAAFVRVVAGASSIDRRVAAVESHVFGREPVATNVRRMPARTLAPFVVVLASAAAVLLMVRRSGPMSPISPISPISATAPPSAVAPEADPATSSTSPHARSAATTSAPLPLTATSLLDAERALLAAPDETRDTAFGRVRSALADTRDARLAAMIARRGGTP